MDECLLRVGLPVKCRKCRLEGRVKPHNYGGWYKCRIFPRSVTNKWFCPEHYDIANNMEDRFYGMSETPQPVASTSETVEDLYKLLD